jgi:hypothetical protein
MVSSDKVHVSPRRSHEQNASAPQFFWKTYDLPYEYIAANWPIRVSDFLYLCFIFFEFSSWALTPTARRFWLWQERADFVTSA